jgi:hypothetical protein
MHSKETISFDSTLGALSNVHRRRLLVELLGPNPRDDSPVEAVADTSQREAAAHLISMRHAHLPKLAEEGFIQWDQANGDVFKGPNFDEIRPLLELLVEHESELPPNFL